MPRLQGEIDTMGHSTGDRTELISALERLSPPYAWEHRWEHPMTLCDLCDTVDHATIRIRHSHALENGPAWTRTRDQPIMSRLL